ncbi:MAG: 50S ribosomal protein L6 [bacterium]
MSRVGKNPIPLGDKVKASVQDGELRVEGPQGKLSMHLPPEVTVVVEAKQILVKRNNEERAAKSNHGLTRALIANMVEGVTQGFKRELDITGVGYRAELKGQELILSLGFSHQVNFPIPTGIKVTVDKQTHVTILGADKQLVGQVSSEIRNVKPPEPYKGKGVKFSDEVIRRKAGKAAGAGAKGGK